MPFIAEPECQAEWFDSPTVPVDSLTIPLPEPNEDYAYAAARLLSWFPVVNSKGATYFQEDFDYSLLDTLRGKQANLEHDKTRIVGTIKDYIVNDEGIDIAVEIDRKCAELQGLDMSDLRSGKYFSHVSVELTRSLSDSYFYGIDDGFNVMQKIPVKTGLSIGMRRTTDQDPYKLQGNRVVERIKPMRFTGVGFVPNPADDTAALYAIAASADSQDKEITTMKHEINVYANDHVDMSRGALTPGHHYADPGWQEDGKKRYQLDDPEHVKSAAEFFGEEKNRDKYNPEHRKEIDDTIAAAEKKFGIGSDKSKKTESASAEEHPNIKEIPEMTEAELNALRETAAKAEGYESELTTLRGELEALKGELESLKTEHASAVTERDALKTEKVERETAAAIDAFVGECEAIMPFASDDERKAFREEAAAYHDDAGRKHLVKVTRELDATKAKLAELTTPPSTETPETPATETPSGEETPAGGEGGGSETASDDFKAKRPAVAISPTFEAVTRSGKYKKEELDAIF